VLHGQNVTVKRYSAPGPDDVDTDDTFDLDENFRYRLKAKDYRLLAAIKKLDEGESL
jgi:hypothetical protein